MSELETSRCATLLLKGSTPRFVPTSRARAGAPGIQSKCSMGSSFNCSIQLAISLSSAAGGSMAAFMARLLKAFSSTSCAQAVRNASTACAKSTRKQAESYEAHLELVRLFGDVEGGNLSEILAFAIGLFALFLHAPATDTSLV